MELEHQGAIAPGAGRGIGKAIALRFAREGADVAIADVTRESAESTAAEIRALGRRAEAFTTDVSNYDQVQALVAGTVEKLGGVDVLVNNAGIAKGQPFLEIT